MVNIIVIRQPSNQKEFDDMFDLRWSVLRKPWNQPKGSEKDDREEDSFTFIALLDNKVVGTIRLQENTENEGQLRYLAVEKQHRNQKIGRDLIQFAEWYARKKELFYLWLNARKMAKDFFLKQDYSILKEGPTIYGEIEHFVMEKNLEK